MTFKELKTALAASKGKQLLLQLPDEKQVPVSFHITEVGQIHKVFMDCGGKVRSNLTAILQVWVGSDEDHRLTIDKFNGILKKTDSVIPRDDIPLEVEYEDSVISQYPVEGYATTHDGLVLKLGLKHTDCLAKDVCLPGKCGDEEAAPVQFKSGELATASRKTGCC